MLKDILSYGIGTLTAFVLVAGLAFLFIRGITQKKHSVLRNDPIVGRSRVEEQGLHVRAGLHPGAALPPEHLRHARELRREHVHIVQASGQSVALDMLYPYPEPKVKMKVA